MVEVADLFQNIVNFNKELNLVFVLLFFTTVIVIYSIFVFYFYRFLAKKNILELNLNQYNNYDNPSIVKFFAMIFFFLEYILLLPIVTFFWFAVLAILITLIAKDISTGTILLISAALIASVRVTSYISNKLSTDLAKMVPFTFLAIAITTAGFFNVQSLMMRITEIPNLFNDILYFLLFIVMVEIVMRTADFISHLFYIKPEEDETEGE
jgi:hypothetical protein